MMMMMITTNDKTDDKPRVQTNTIAFFHLHFSNTWATYFPPSVTEKGIT